MPNFALDTEVGQPGQPQKVITCCASTNSNIIINTSPNEGHPRGQRRGRIHHREARQGQHAREVDGQEDRLPDTYVQRLCRLQRGERGTIFFTVY